MLWRPRVGPCEGPARSAQDPPSPPMLPMWAPETHQPLPFFCRSKLIVTVPDPAAPPCTDTMISAVAVSPCSLTLPDLAEILTTLGMLVMSASPALCAGSQ